MTERPILFNGAMVRAILDGRKTQTRRIVKEPMQFAQCDEDFKTGDLHDSYHFNGDLVRRRSLKDIAENFCPYGKVGDRFWVRETWQVHPQYDFVKPSDLPTTIPVHYPATNSNVGEISFHHGKTRVSIHMPRWASRIQLEITNVRVERLQSISDDDCLREGVHRFLDGWSNGLMGPFVSPNLAFKCLWDEVMGWDSWPENPWVWVIEFKRVDL